MRISNKYLSVTAILAIAVLCSNFAFAEPLIGVHVDVKCKDETIKYNAEKAIHAAIKSTDKHKLDATDSARIEIKLAILSIGNPEDEDEVIGVSIAILTVSKNKKGKVSIKKFTNLLTTPDQYEAKIEKVASKILE